VSARTIIEAVGRTYQLYSDVYYDQGALYGQPDGEPVSDAGYFFINSEKDPEVLGREERDFEAINRLEVGAAHDMGNGYAVKRLT
jgi:hypothetical protein